MSLWLKSGQTDAWTVAIQPSGNSYLSGGNFGLGTSDPSAQLHTTGTVRFEGLSGTDTRVLHVQPDGTVFATNPVSEFYSYSGTVLPADYDGCFGTVDSDGICAGYWYVDITFPSPFASVPKVVVAIGATAPSAPCARGNSDSTAGYATRITKSGFRIIAGASPGSESSCSNNSGMGTPARIVWTATSH